MPGGGVMSSLVENEQAASRKQPNNVKTENNCFIIVSMERSTTF